MSNGHLQVPDQLQSSRTPSPDLPPPPQLDHDQEVVENDTPLPPPPALKTGDQDKTVIQGSKSRTSPATIAARGAPGWERFLGGNTSSVTFTSDEARKFRRTKDKNRARAGDTGPKSLPFNLNKDGLKPLTPAKSSPSLNDKTPPPVSNNKQWWKTSMDSLRMSGGDSALRGQTLSHHHQGEQSKCDQVPASVVSHSHSSSDSGLSSLSGRTSCMSPLSVVSTGSSASSGSSRASLRSASIVSSSTIPLDEDEEDQEMMNTVRRNQVKTGQDQDTDLISKTAAELFSAAGVSHDVTSLFGKKIF